MQERARADAEALRWRLQSTKRRRADEVACAFAAVTASGPCTSDAFKLLASCVSCATAVVCVVALAAPVTDSPTGGGGAFRHMSGATERAREISRHRLQLQRELKRCRGEVEAHATELTRRRFGCGLRSAPNPPVGSYGRGAAAGGEIFWGAEGPVPRGAHRVNELWSEPRSRLASAADAACSLLARASRVCSGVGVGRRVVGRGGTAWVRTGDARSTRRQGCARWRARRRCSPSRRRDGGGVEARSRAGRRAREVRRRRRFGLTGRGCLARRRPGRMAGSAGWGAGFPPSAGGCLVGSTRDAPLAGLEGPGLRSGRSGHAAAARDGTDGDVVVIVRSLR